VKPIHYLILLCLIPGSVGCQPEDTSPDRILIAEITLQPIGQPVEEEKPSLPTQPPLPTPVATPAGERRITIVAVGDVMPGRAVNVQMEKLGDYTWPFQRTVDVLNPADLTIGNLETPIIDDCPVDFENRPFCADPKSVEGLVYAGFDGLSLANNHTLDQGEQGFLDTGGYLLDAGIQPLVTERTMVRDVNGVRVAVLAFDDTAGIDINLDEATEMIRQADRNAEVVIGIIHWGNEYVSEPTTHQRLLGQTMIDAGMDVVIGSGPHWVQPVEKYGDGLIFYSLGNFVFDQMWSWQTRQGYVAVLNITVEGDNLTIDYEAREILIHNFGQPQFEDSVLE